MCVHGRTQGWPWDHAPLNKLPKHLKNTFLADYSNVPNRELLLVSMTESDFYDLRDHAINFGRYSTYHLSDFPNDRYFKPIGFEWTHKSDVLLCLNDENFNVWAKLVEKKNLAAIECCEKIHANLNHRWRPIDKVARGKYGGVKTPRWKDTAIDGERYENDFDPEWDDVVPIPERYFEWDDSEATSDDSSDGDSSDDKSSHWWSDSDEFEVSVLPERKGFWDFSALDTEIELLSPAPSISHSEAEAVQDAIEEAIDIGIEAELLAPPYAAEHDAGDDLSNWLSTTPSSYDPDADVLSNWLHTLPPSSPGPLTEGVVATPNWERGAISGTYTPKRSSPLKASIAVDGLEVEEETISIGLDLGHLDPPSEANTFPDAEDDIVYVDAGTQTLGPPYPEDDIYDADAHLSNWLSTIPLRIRAPRAREIVATPQWQRGAIFGTHTPKRGSPLKTSVLAEDLVEHGEGHEEMLSRELDSVYF